MDTRKIITLLGQKHNYKDLGEIFTEATEEEKEAILYSLGLDTLVSTGGGVIPRYRIDITSDKPVFIQKDYNITITGKVYNFFDLVPDTILREYAWTRDSGNVDLDTAWAVGKTTESLVLKKEDFPNIENKNTTFKLKVTIGGRTAEDSITFTKNQTLGKIQIKSTTQVFLDNTPSTATLSIETESEVESYGWYIDNYYRGNSKTFTIDYSDIAPGAVGVIKAEVTTPSGEILTDTYSIPRVKNGVNGQGVQGPKGETGKATYTWIKYADDAVGTDMSDLPIKPNGAAREYLGLATNRDSPTESNNFRDYNWSKYIGESSLMWVKYSIYYNGRDTDGDVSMQDTPYTDVGGGVRENMVYMGIAYNQETTTESNIPEDYLWAKILGDDGHSGYTLDLSNDNVSVPALGDGSVPKPEVAFSLANTTLSLYYGNDLVSPTEYDISYVATPGLTILATLANHKVQVTNMSTDVGEIVFKVHPKNDPSKTLSSATFSIVKVKGSSSYEILASSNIIKINSNAGAGQTIEPVSINVKVQINTGQSVADYLGGVLTYRYIYEDSADPNPDGTPYDRVNPFIINNDGDPLFLEFKFFHPITGSLVDVERIPFVRDGVNGLTVEFRYKKNTDPIVAPTIDRSVDAPTGWTIAAPDVAMGEALWMTKVNKYSQGGAIVGLWDVPVRISGTPGTPGNPGAPGTPGSNGAPGINGTTGPSPRLLEFVAPATYENGATYIDYAYFRSSNPATEGWYTVKLPLNHTPGTKVTAVYTGGIPVTNPTTGPWVKTPFTKEMSFGNIVAEQANLAGFIFRNQLLQSQAVETLGACHINSGNKVANLSLDGLDGVISFLDRLVLNRDGLAFKDICGRSRIVFNLDKTGVPILKFLNEIGETTWEAGKDGYIPPKIIVTRPESWIALYADYTLGEPTGIPNETNINFNDLICSTQGGADPIGTYYYRQAAGPNYGSPIGYKYDKGIKDPLTPHTQQELDADGKYFKTQSIGSQLVNDGYYMESFRVVKNGTNNVDINTKWLPIVAGKERFPKEVQYSQPIFNACTVTQTQQWTEALNY